MSNNSKLAKDLRKLGANSVEADELARLASALGGVKPRGLSRATKLRISEIPPGRPASFLWINWFRSGVVATLVIVVASAVLLLSPSKPESTMHDTQSESQTSTSSGAEFVEAPDNGFLAPEQVLEEPKTPDVQQEEQKSSVRERQRDDSDEQESWYKRWWWFSR